MLAKSIYSQYCFRLVLLVLVLLSVTSTISAEDYFHFDYVGFEQGLQSSSIENIVQDNEGYMWFGTQDGLYKYDGRYAKKYSNDGEEGSLLSDDISDLLISSKNVLWVATNTGGISVFNNQSDSFVSFTDSSSANKLQHYKTTSLAEFNNKIWVATERGIASVRQDNYEISHVFLNNPNNEVKKNYFSRKLLAFNGMLLALINQRIYKLNPKENIFEIFNFEGFNHHSYFSTSEHYSIFLGNNKELFVYTTDGLFRFDSVSKQITIEPLNINEKKYERLLIKEILIDSYQTTWITTLGHGVFYRLVKQSSYKKIPIGPGRNQLNTDQLFSIFQDNTNNIWIGTDGFYSAKFRTPQHIFPFYSNFYKQNRSDHTNTIWSFENFNDEIYLATDNGIFQLNEFDNDIKPLLTTEKYRQTYDLLSTDKEMYIGGLNGLNSILSNGVTQNYNHLISRASENKITSDNTVTQLAQSDSHLFVGTFNGLIAINNKTKETAYYNHKNADYKIHNGVIMALAYDKNENLLWVGSETGIEVISTKINKKVNVISEILKTINGYVNDIHIDKTGHVWIAVDNTLYRFTPENALIKYNHYPENEIRSIETVDNDIWMTTPTGMIKASIDNLEEFIYYIQEDGLYNTGNTTMASIYLEDSDELLFGGDKGFIRFNSKIDIPVMEAVAPKMNVVSLLNTEEQADILERILSNGNLKYFENSLRFEFAHLDFKAPLKTKFHYQLVGFDTSWSKLSNENYASYTNLKAGDYIFRVKVYDANGVLRNKELSVHFTIETAWWKSDFAYFMYFSLFLFLMFFILRWYKTEQVRIKNLQIQRNKEEFISGYNRYALSLTELQSHQTLVRKFLDQIKLITGAVFIQYKQFLMEALLDISIGKPGHDYVQTTELELTTKNAIAQLYFKNNDLESLDAVSADIQILFQQMIILQGALIDKQKYNWNDYFSSVTGLHNVKSFKNILRDEVERAEINDLSLVFYEWVLEKSQFKENELLKRIQLLSYGDKLKEVFGVHLIATFSEKFDNLSKFIVFVADENAERISQYESKFDKNIRELQIMQSNGQVNQYKLKLVRLNGDFEKYIESL